jgi:hypothetical protein
MERLSAEPAAEDTYRLGAERPSLHAGSPELVKQNVPAAELRYFDGGHFALDEYADEVADAIIETFSR